MQVISNDFNHNIRLKFIKFQMKYGVHSRSLIILCTLCLFDPRVRTGINS